MATFQAIFAPQTQRNTQIASLGAVTSSADQVLGETQNTVIFVITASQTVTIRFGNSGNIANADATDFPIYANTYQEFAVPIGCDRFRVFNTSATTAASINYWPLSKG